MRRNVLQTRRHTLRIGASAIGSYIVAVGSNAWGEAPSPSVGDAIEQVVPTSGIRLRFSFGDSIQKLVTAGVIDPPKYVALYEPDRGVPEWARQILAAPSNRPIVLDRTTAPYLLNLLWPLGLASKLKINQKSPINTLRIPSFASTGGWTLGHDKNGYVYFDRVEALALSSAQEALAYQVATTTYRPCCDNPTFFQDCNHGSALFGLIALMASQGGSEEELYRAALTANSYWFQDKYVLTALQFMRTGHPSWRSVDPKVVLGRDFSSLSGWQHNVSAPLNSGDVKLPPDLAGQLACGI